MLEKRLLLVLSACLMICLQVIAQPNALVTGRINGDMAKKIELRVDQTWYDNTTVRYESEVDDQGRFAFAVNMEVPQEVTIHYARNMATIYLEPGDSLHINADANAFQYSMRFFGQGAPNNTFLARYNKQFPYVDEPFKMQQFKKNILWYKVHEDEAKKMNALAPTQYKELRRKLKQQRHLYLESYEKQFGLVSDQFRQYITAEINYEWSYKMLLYGYAFGNKHKIDGEFFNFMRDVTINNPQLGSKMYRRYLIGFINYMHDQEKGSGNPFVEQYNLAGKILSGQPKYWTQSNILITAIKKKHLEDILESYSAYLSECPDYGMSTKLIEAYQKTASRAVGSTAPNFTLNDLDGNSVSLSDYRGKIVYLDFWATWCRPCLQKMSKMKPFIQEMKNNDQIVFLQVSLDRQETTWKGTVEVNSFGGVHLIAENDVDSEVTKAYNVRALPESFIIDRNGKFSPKPASLQLKELEELLKSLASK